MRTTAAALSANRNINSKVSAIVNMMREPGTSSPFLCGHMRLLDREVRRAITVDFDRDVTARYTVLD
jgi:hypothetical protein